MPEMPPLPAKRVRVARSLPFEYTDLDYLGPLYFILRASAKQMNKLCRILRRYGCAYSPAFLFRQSIWSWWMTCLPKSSSYAYADLLPDGDTTANNL